MSCRGIHCDTGIPRLPDVLGSTRYLFHYGIGPACGDHHSEKRTAYEVEVDDVGPSLRNASAKVAVRVLHVASLLVARDRAQAALEEALERAKHAAGAVREAERAEDAAAKPSTGSVLPPPSRRAGRGSSGDGFLLLAGRSESQGGRGSTATAPGSPACAAAAHILVRVSSPFSSPLVRTVRD